MRWNEVSTKCLKNPVCAEVSGISDLSSVRCYIFISHFRYSLVALRTETALTEFKRVTRSIFNLNMHNNTANISHKQQPKACIKQNVYLMR